MRWQHPTNGLVGPDVFIPIAEETGLIVPLGELVMRDACRQLRRWHDLGFLGLRVAINISGRQFEDPQLVTSFRNAVNAAGVHPSDIDLEITETVVMRDVEAAVLTLRELKKLGTKVLVDDFGTGYSALSSLKRLPIDALKIDRAFIRDTPDDEDDVAIVQAVIALAHSLGLPVVAEGVENEEQLGFLRRHDCNEFQGFYFSRPLDATNASILLNRCAEASALF